MTSQAAGSMGTRFHSVRLQAWACIFYQGRYMDQLLHACHVAAQKQPWLLNFDRVIASSWQSWR